MNILLMGAFPPPYGGVQVHMVELRDHLRRNGHNCVGINLTKHRKANADGVFYPRTALGVLWLLCRLEYDVIHLHIGGDLPMRFIVLCLLCSWIPGKRVFLTFHSGGYSSSDEAKAAGPATIRGFVLRQLDGLIAVNNDIADVFLRYGALPNRVHVISPWTSPSALPRGPIPEDLQHFLRAHSPLLTTVGLLEPEYDLALQIDALEKVRAQWPQAGLVIVGSGSLEESLRRQIRGKPYGDHVRLCGDVPRPATLRLIEGSNIFLRTTLYDGDALSVREALHLGVPTIATDNGMRPEGVLLIPVSNAEMLVQAISTALVSPKPRVNHEGRQDRNLDALVDIYQVFK